MVLLTDAVPPSQVETVSRTVSEEFWGNRERASETSADPESEAWAKREAMASREG